MHHNKICKMLKEEYRRHLKAVGDIGPGGPNLPWWLPTQWWTVRGALHLAAYPIKALDFQGRNANKFRAAGVTSRGWMLDTAQMLRFEHVWTVYQQLFACSLLPPGSFGWWSLFHFLYTVTFWLEPNYSHPRSIKVFRFRFWPCTGDWWPGKRAALQAGEDGQEKDLVFREAWWDLHKSQDVCKQLQINSYYSIYLLQNMIYHENSTTCSWMCTVYVWVCVCVCVHC